MESETWSLGRIGSSGIKHSSGTAGRTGDAGLGPRSSKGFLSVSVYGVRISAGWGSQSDLDAALWEFGVFPESSSSFEAMFRMSSSWSRKSSKSRRLRRARISSGSNSELSVELVVGLGRSGH